MPGPLIAYNLGRAPKLFLQLVALLAPFIGQPDVISEDPGRADDRDQCFIIP